MHGILHFAAAVNATLVVLVAAPASLEPITSSGIERFPQHVLYLVVVFVRFGGCELNTQRGIEGKR